MAIRDNEIAALRNGRRRRAVQDDWHSASRRDASPASPARLGAIVGASSWRRTATPSQLVDLAVPRHGGRRRRLAARLDRSAPPSSSSCPTSPKEISKGLSGAVSTALLLFLVIYPRAARRAGRLTDPLRSADWRAKAQEELRIFRTTTKGDQLCFLPVRIAAISAGDRRLSPSTSTVSHSPRRNTTPAQAIPRSRSGRHHPLFGTGLRLRRDRQDRKKPISR